MKLFNRTPKQSSSPGQKPVELVYDKDNESVCVAFGLQWSTIVTQGGADAGKKIAKTRGATHFIFKNQQIGYGVIQPRDGTQIFPAAHIAARQHGGDAVHAIRIGPGEYWLCLIRNSQPTSVDKFIHSAGDELIESETRKLIETSAVDGIELTVYTNLESHDFGATKNNSVEDLLLACGSEQDAMQELSGSSLTIPKPLLYGAAALALVLLAKEGWKLKVARDRANAIAVAGVPVDEPPEVAWTRAIGNWEKSHARVNESGLSAVRSVLGTVPAKWSGWRLLDVKCMAGDVVSTGPAGSASGVSYPMRNWNCAANYERSKVGILNRQMDIVAPEGWLVTFVPLNKMRATWTMPESVEVFKFLEMPSKKFHLVETVSRIQEIAPAFSSEVDFAFAPIAIPIPKRTDGSAYPADPKYSGSSSKLLIKGPLRSIDKLMQAGVPADWDSFSLTVDATNSGTSSTINQSAISAEVSGVIYAKNN